MSLEINTKNKVLNVEKNKVIGHGYANITNLNNKQSIMNILSTSISNIILYIYTGVLIIFRHYNVLSPRMFALKYYKQKLKNVCLDISKMKKKNNKPYSKK